MDLWSPQRKDTLVRALGQLWAVPYRVVPLLTLFRGSKSLNPLGKTKDRLNSDLD